MYMIYVQLYLHVNIVMYIYLQLHVQTHTYRVRHTQLPPIDPSQFDVNKSPQLPRSSDVSTILYTVTTTNNYYYFRREDV